MNISPTPEIIDDIRLGRMVVLVDAEDRENEGDLVLAADFVTPEAINFMAMHARGLICLTLTEERCRQLALPLMVSDNRSPHGTAFTVSIEAATGVTTGISAADRARTVRVAVAKHAKPSDIVQPGHIFPVMAQNGGVLVRAGHTEAGCDLAELAGLTPAAVICEVMKPDGEMARLPDLIEFAARHELKLGTIADLIRHRSVNEKLIERVADRHIATPYGPFRLCVYHDSAANELHYALVRGEPSPDRPVLVRVHEPFHSIDVFDFDASRHAYSVQDAMRIIAHHKEGVIVLLRPARVGRRDPAALLARAPALARRAQVGPEAARHRRADPARPGRGPHARARAAQAHPEHGGLRPRGGRVRLPRRRHAGEGPMTAYRSRPQGRRAAPSAIVWSRFNEDIVRELLTACDRELVNLGVAPADIDVVSVPGALEIPLALQALALRTRGFGRRYDALVALGAVIRGETYHFEVVSNESARGILDVQLETGVPVANAVLTTSTEEQARERASVKGAEAARVAVEMANLLKAVNG